MEHLHNNRRMGDTAEWHQAEVPQAWMSLVFEICEEIEDGGAVACEEPRLNFVSPHLVLACRKRADCEEKARQTECVVPVSILHYLSVILKFRLRFLFFIGERDLKSVAISRRCFLR